MHPEDPPKKKRLPEALKVEERAAQGTTGMILVLHRGWFRVPNGSHKTLQIEVTNCNQSTQDCDQLLPCVTVQSPFFFWLSVWMLFFFFSLKHLKPNFWLLRYMLSPLSQTIFPGHRNWQAQAIWRSWLALNVLLWSWWIRPTARLPGRWRRNIATGGERRS